MPGPPRRALVADDEHRIRQPRAALAHGGHAGELVVEHPGPARSGSSARSRRASRGSPPGRTPRGAARSACTARGARTGHLHQGAGTSATASRAKLAPRPGGAVEVAAGDQLADQRRRAARAVHRLRHVAAAGRGAPRHRRAARELGQLVLRGAGRRWWSRRSRPRPTVAVGQRAAVEELRRPVGARERDGPPPRAPLPPPSPRGISGSQPVAELGEPEVELATAIVLAVNWHRTCRTRQPRSIASARRGRVPHSWAPSASQTSRMVSSRPPRCPARCCEQHRRLVEARERQRQALVAADDADERVEVVRDRHQLDRVGDHLARDQRARMACPATGCRRPRSC